MIEARAVHYPAPARLRPQHKLAPHTTLGLGGSAQYWLPFGNRLEVQAALAWAKQDGLPVTVLAGGSNVVIADPGVAGLLLHPSGQGIHYHASGEYTEVSADAGVSFDQLVHDTTQRGLTGLECLSGIPGTVGATPVQNVGAYGVEIASSLQRIEAVCLASGAVEELSAADCGFGYRTSRFREHPGQHVITAVTFALRQGTPLPVSYPELRAKLAEPSRHSVRNDGPPSPQRIRDAVLRLRRAKSMVVDPDDPHSRSVGSFFKNPVVSRAEAERVCAWAEQNTGKSAPCYPAGPEQADQRKLSAAWLIEQSGLRKGTRRGSVGISAHHALALVHYGDGTTCQLLELAREVQKKVFDFHGVALHPEPIFLGFSHAPLTGATLVSGALPG